MLADVLYAGWTAIYLPAYLLWVGGVMVRQMGIGPQRLVEIKREIHPFLPFMILANLVFTTWGTSSVIGKVIMYGLAIFNIYGWLTDKDDDDRWKRRRRKLVSKLQRQGSRLVAVPVGGR